MGSIVQMAISALAGALTENTVRELLQVALETIKDEDLIESTKADEKVLQVLIDALEN